MKRQIAINLARGLFYTGCVILPLALFGAWAKTGFWQDNRVTWLEFLSAALNISIYIFFDSWYLTFPLVAAIASCFYFRKQTRQSLKK